MTVSRGAEVSSALDFRATSTITGRTYDGFRVQWLEGVSARVVELDGMTLSSDDSAPEWTVPSALTDALGAFTLALPKSSSGTLELSKQGFAILREPFGAVDERGSVELAPVPLEPITSLEVQLRASNPHDFTSYSIEPFGDRGKTFFSVDGRAELELAAWLPQPFLHLLYPDGNGRRIDLPRFPGDSNPLVIDLDPAVELRVEIEGWSERDPSLEHWVTVTTARTDSNVLEIVSTRLHSDSDPARRAVTKHPLLRSCTPSRSTLQRTS